MNTLALGVLAWSLLHQGTPDRGNRLEFAKAMAKVEAGMTKAQVRALVGDPDKTVLTGKYLNKEYWDEIWQFGANAAVPYPTLGTVIFGTDGTIKVKRSHSLPVANLPDEKTTRDALQAIALVAKGNDSLEDNSGFSRSAILACNYLSRLGEKRGTAVMNEFFRINESGGGYDNDTNLVGLVRLIVVVPSKPGYLPVPMIGAIEPDPPHDLRRAPLYPWAISDGVPFDMILGINLAGFPEPPQWHMRRLLKISHFRKSSLVPTDKPWRAADELIAGTYLSSIHDPYRTEDIVKSRIRRQVASLLKTAIQYKGELNVPSYVNTDSIWYAMEKEWESMPIRWDPKAEKYILTPSRQPHSGLHLKQDTR